jgi:CDP-glucose 4,6-dehydratase
VLAPLSGYLVLAQALWDSSAAAGAWNFGPPQHELRPVGWVADRLAELWPEGLRWEHDERAHPPERAWLAIDSAKAREQLGWREPLTLEGALAATAEWYARFRDGADMREVTLEQIATLCGSPGTAPQEAPAGHLPQGGR